MIHNTELWTPFTPFWFLLDQIASFLSLGDKPLTVFSAVWFIIKFAGISITGLVLFFLFILGAFEFVLKLLRFFGRHSPVLTEKESEELATLKEKSQSLSQRELHELGTRRYELCRYALAIEMFTLAVEKDAFCDEVVPTLLLRSEAYSKVGRHKNAYEDAGFCCGIRPDFADGFERRGDTAEKLKEYQIALESYDQCLRLGGQSRTVEKKRRQVIDNLHTRKEAREVSERLEHDLEQGIVEDEMKFEKACDLFLHALFWKDFRLAKSSFKLGARLDAVFDGDDADEFDKQQIQRFTLKQQEHYRHRLCDTDTKVISFANALVMLIQYCPSEMIAASDDAYSQKQLDLLNFTLDVVDAQGFSLPFCFAKASLLRGVCFSVKSAPNTLGTDCILAMRSSVFSLLLNRVKSAKRLFLDDGATDQEFATALLATLFRSLPRGSKEQEVHDVVEALLKFGADVNVTQIYPSKKYKKAALPPNCDSILSCMPPILQVLGIMDSPLLLNLLLDHNADPNRIYSPPMSNGIEPLAGTALDFSLHVGQWKSSRCFRLLASRGAKFSSELTSNFVLTRVPTKKWGPIVQRYQTPMAFEALTRYNWVDSAGNEAAEQKKRKEFEEFVDLVFSQVEKQGCSFLYSCKALTTSGLTPLTAYLMFPDEYVGNIENNMKVILKRKPALVSTPSILQNKNDPIQSNVSYTPVGCVAHRILWPATTSSSIVDRMVKILELLLNNGAERFGIHMTLHDPPRVRFELTLEQIIDPVESCFKNIPSWKIERIQKFLKEYDKEKKQI